MKANTKPKTLIPIIYYHSVAPAANPRWVFQHLTLETDCFEAQIRLLIDMGYRFVSLEDIYRFQIGEKDLHPRSVGLTFDDGYLDYWQYVFPLQKKYGFPSTIFISPEFVDTKHGVRPNSDDYSMTDRTGKVPPEENVPIGHLSWNEMAIMVKSGLVDIQSHTMTHTQYFVSDRLTGFHFPDSDNIFPIWNLHPEKKPYYIEDPEFDRSIPYGYPIFRQDGAMVGRRVEINPDFSAEAVESVKGYNFFDKSMYPAIHHRLRAVYQHYKNTDNLVAGRETEAEYHGRIAWELSESKRIIEHKLGRAVTFCCWPMGYTTEETHQQALDVGYWATTQGKSIDSGNDPSRFIRIGLGKVRNHPWLTRLKFRYQVRSFQRRFPDYPVKVVYYWFRHHRLP
ncbi:MAG: polysaccharide deacetylase family protein [Candidatus Omnitrophota bacterium]